jgi:heme-binding protein
MLVSTSVARRAAAAAIGTGAIAGVMFFGGAPSALADPPPPAPLGCSAADFEQVKGDVAVATAGYFFSHPDVNAFFSTLKGQPRDQIDRQVKDYYAANPQVQSEMNGVRQPMRDFKARCQ